MANHSSYKPLIIRSVLIAVAVIGVGFGAWRLGLAALEKSRWALLNKVEVTGLERLSRETIIKAANLRGGTNLMQLPLDQIAARISKVPGVKLARVVPKVPNRILIEVEEREPVACLQGKSILLVDEAGVLFPTVGPGELIDLPVITGEIDSKRNPQGLKRAAAFAGKVKEAYPTTYRHLGELTLKGGKFEVRLREGGATVLATDPSSPAAMVKLEQFLIQRGAELTPRSQYVDLRYPAMVVTGTEG